MDQAALLLEDAGPAVELRLAEPAVEPPPPPAARAPAAPPERRLELAPVDLEATFRLQRELGIGRVLSHVLVRRGLADPSRARAFLEPADAHAPSAFAGIDRAVATVRSHIAGGSRIVVHGDYD